MSLVEARTYMFDVFQQGLFWAGGGGSALVTASLDRLVVLNVESE